MTENVLEGKRLEKPSEEGDMIQTFCGVQAEDLCKGKRAEVLGLPIPDIQPSPHAINTYIYFIIFWGERIEQRIHEGLSGE